MATPSASATCSCTAPPTSPSRRSAGRGCTCASPTGSSSTASARTRCSATTSARRGATPASSETILRCAPSSGGAPPRTSSPRPRQAIARSAVPAAVALFGQAAAMQPTGSPEHVDALVELGAALLTAGRLEAADAALADAEAAARAAGHAPARAHAGVLRLQVALQVDPAPALAAHPGRDGAGRDDVRPRARRARHVPRRAHTRARRTGSPGAARRPARPGSGRRRMPARGRHEWALPDMLAWVASSLQLGPEPVPSAIARCERLREETQSHPLLAGVRDAPARPAVRDERRARALTRPCSRSATACSTRWARRSTPRLTTARRRRRSSRATPLAPSASCGRASSASRRWATARSSRWSRRCSPVPSRSRAVPTRRSS